MKPVVCLILGLTCATSHAQTKFALARYQSNGALDSSFGEGGRVATGFKDPDTLADIPASLKDVALYSGTNTIAVGKAGKFAALAAYTASGTLDPAFNNGAGTRLLHLATPSLGKYFSANSESGANAVAVKNGKIVVAGWFAGEECNLPQVCSGLFKRFAVARFNPDGALDGTFGNGGRVTISFEDLGYTPSEAYAVTIDANDRIIVGGTAKRSTGKLTFNFAVARYHWNGTPDLIFGQDGKVIRSVISYEIYSTFLLHEEAIHDLTTDASGRIVATGVVLEKHNAYKDGIMLTSSFVVFRLIWNGLYDWSFHPNGILPILPVATAYGYNISQPAQGFAIALEADGRIVTGGENGIQPPNSGLIAAFTVARVHSSGQMDNSFSGDGVQETLFPIAPPYYDSGVRDLALIGDKILTVGWSGEHFALAKYNNTGTLDSSFGVNGRVVTNFSCDGPESAKAIAVPQFHGSNWFLVGGTAAGDPCPGRL